MSAVPGILGEILERRRQELAAQRRRVSLEGMRRMAEARARDDLRPFAEALKTRSRDAGCAIIAELKKASPSAGTLREKYVPEEIARSYERGGACCLSVLTEPDFFRGDLGHLRAARAAAALPVLRKDFLFDAYQIEESMVLGADCILLIAALFADDPPRMKELAAHARERGMDALAEVHDAAELELVLDTEANILGINNRDLRSFETRLETTLELLPQVPESLLTVSESGIHSAEDVRRLQEAGAHCFLVGEALMRAPDPGQALQALQPGPASLQ